MQNKFSILTLALLASAALSGCAETASSVQSNSNKPAAQTNAAANKSAAAPTTTTSAGDGRDQGGPESVKRVTVEEAKAAVDAGKAVIVDVRSADAYKTKHIKGSISMPDAATGYQSLPKDKQIITYCS